MPAHRWTVNELQMMQSWFVTPDVRKAINNRDLLGAARLIFREYIGHFRAIPDETEVQRAARQDDPVRALELASRRRAPHATKDAYQNLLYVSTILRVWRPPS